MFLTRFRTDFSSSVWNFCRWVADIPPCETSLAVKSKENFCFRRRHCMVSVNLAIAIKAPSKNQCFVYDYIRGDFEGLWPSLRAANLVNSVSNDDVNININWHNWKDTLLAAVKDHIPKKKRNGRNPVPCINGPMVNLIEKKESTHMKLKHLHQAIWGPSLETCVLRSSVEYARHITLFLEMESDLRSNPKCF